jgi:putative membrane protein
VRRRLSTDRERATQVRTVAASLFFDRGIANTQRETGVLVYLSLLERRMEILADRGILAGVPALEWNRLVESVRSRRDATTLTLLDTLRALTPLLGLHLPVGEDDQDELADEPRFECE